MDPSTPTTTMLPTYHIYLAQSTDSSKWKFKDFYMSHHTPLQYKLKFGAYQDWPLNALPDDYMNWLWGQRIRVIAHPPPSQPTQHERKPAVLSQTRRLRATQYKFTFGEHKNQYMEQVPDSYYVNYLIPVLKSNPAELQKYCSSVVEALNAFFEIRPWLLDRRVETEGEDREYRLTFGIHKGRRLSEVPDSYMDSYLIPQKKGDVARRCKEVVAALDEYLAKRAEGRRRDVGASSSNYRAASDSGSEDSEGGITEEEGEYRMTSGVYKGKRLREVPDLFLTRFMIPQKQELWNTCPKDAAALELFQKARGL